MMTRQDDTIIFKPGNRAETQPDDLWSLPDTQVGTQGDPEASDLWSTSKGMTAYTWVDGRGDTATDDLWEIKPTGYTAADDLWEW